MEIVGSVAPEEVPERTSTRLGRPGKWSLLCQRAISDHETGRITVVKTRDPKELKSMKNSMVPTLRKQGYKFRPLVIEQNGEYRVFLELALRQVEPEAEASPNGHP